MCFHKVYYYEGCGHCASSGNIVCKAVRENTESKKLCERTTWRDVNMGNKRGKCDQCVSQLPTPPETPPASPVPDDFPLAELI